MSETGPKDFFITYNHRDEAWATWIAQTLEAAGQTTLIQAWDFLPGDNFMAKMDEGLSSCKRTLGVLSAHYLTSLFTRAEWTAAYRQTLLGKPRGFVPVRVAECEVAPLLGPLVYIDLVGVDVDEARSRLLAGVGDSVRREPRLGGFPGTSTH
ncbi:toll/interleukin-1 receptor domain-containing protein [Herbidospora mongoliensis]|uniref:toll/interleukin-1 receptor domain-containing protein n=1 Tax=Herbidospora mongoliensis TaxID=688067 RepID=UPI000830244C|nr:toll/interleukin-1 receptor domain-containing protein [Herbidospora mongoliensis]